MTSSPDKQLELLVTSVQSSAKYGKVSPELIREIGARELSIRRSFKEAVKETKNKLHQVGAVYLDKPVDYKRALSDLESALQSADGEAFRQVSRRLMGFHVSTRERLGILDEFFHRTLAHLQPVRSIVDLACGLNPLAIPWMPMADSFTYYACDIFTDMTAFLQDYFTLAGIAGTAEVRDMLHSIPSQPAEVALLLKAIPCLEQVDKDAGKRLLDEVQADHLLVSFPVQSLGGRKRGMPVNYAAHFEELVAGRTWKKQKFEFSTELAFLITK
jgi:16S rRNA (guanine(1405)-N(7))-methyltransferase